METSYVDVPILESVTNIAKTNSDSQAVNLYYLRCWICRL